MSLSENRLAKLSDDHAELEEKVAAERLEMEQERKVHTQVCHHFDAIACCTLLLISPQLLDELSKELDDLRVFKQHSEGSNGAVRRSSLPRSQRRELEAQIIKLKTVSADLGFECFS
jgi:hypothetical protein